MKKSSGNGSSLCIALMCQVDDFLGNGDPSGREAPTWGWVDGVEGTLGGWVGGLRQGCHISEFLVLSLRKLY